jgi:hypothetical protein
VGDAGTQVYEVRKLVSSAAEETAMQLHLMLHWPPDEEGSPGQSGEGQERAEIDPKSAVDIRRLGVGVKAFGVSGGRIDLCAQRISPFARRKRES